MKLLLDPTLRVLTSLHPTAHFAAQFRFFEVLASSPDDLQGVLVFASAIANDGGSSVLDLVLRRKPDAVVLDLTDRTMAKGRVYSDWAWRWQYDAFLVRYNECVFSLPWWEERSFVVLLRKGLRRGLIVMHTPVKTSRYNGDRRDSLYCSPVAASWVLQLLERNIYHQRSFYRETRGSHLHRDAFRLRAGRTCDISPTEELWAKWPEDDNW